MVNRPGVISEQPLVRYQPIYSNNVQFGQGTWLLVSCGRHTDPRRSSLGIEDMHN